MVKKAIAILNCILLIIIIISSCSIKDKSLKFVDVKYDLIIKPSEYKQSFTIYKSMGDSTISLFKNIFIYQPKRYEPTVKLDEDNTFLLNGYVYNKKTDDLVKEYPIQENCNAYLSPKYNFCAYLSGAPDTPNEAEIQFSNKNDGIDKKFSLFSGYIVAKEKKDLNNVTICWGTESILYYDNINKVLSPCIYRDDENNDELYKDNACYPNISDDGKVFSYWQTDVWEGKGKIEQKMIIEGNGKKKEYPTVKVIKFDSKDKEIYVIDEASGELEVLNQDTFEVKAKGSLDKDFLFPQIVEGKLQYTCPIRNGKEITDYKVVEEN